METHLLLVAVFVVSTLLQLLVSKLLQPALPALSVSGGVIGKDEGPKVEIYKATPIIKF